MTGIQEPIRARLVANESERGTYVRSFMGNRQTNVLRHSDLRGNLYRTVIEPGANNG